ncbi:predicted protein [Methanosarcina acetivorans C2A]|uniref:DUF2769 domain-containing protein n=3 Tax=Methanosarcina acetivorans TaxID=2214 RepID=Q8TQW6_METAC|nr:predicted protein [Methanosarcina acetivorans C2A]
MGNIMVSGNKCRKAFCFHETVQKRAQKQQGTSHKQKMQLKSRSLKAVQISETGEIRQMVADTPENLRICMEHCGTCPSLPFPPEPFLFCARGCSPEKISKKSCNCPTCPIYNKYKLQNLYFCETGKAVKEREEEKNV